MKNTIVWFRQDLRLEDNSALQAAIERGEPILPVFIWAPQEEGDWEKGEAAKWWLHHALADLEAQLAERGLRLVILDARETSSMQELLGLAKRMKVDAVYWNRRFEPAVAIRDASIQRDLLAAGIAAESQNSCLLIASEKISNKSGKPFQVFTPMWKHYQSLEIPDPAKVEISAAKAPDRWPRSTKLDSLGLLPTRTWDAGFHKFWGAPSRKTALKQVRSFIKSGAIEYPTLRDIPSEDGTTRISPYLHLGQLGAREVWKMFAKASSRSPVIESGIMRQIIWREFAHHLLHHFPHTPLEPLRPDYALFPWDDDPLMLRRWQRGETGYPIVDAGMRQLWETGWMHNRVRMIVGSFLVKHLLQHWVEGARWFWDTLVDADLANNTMGWQWIGGCGADAAPYFRIFNPITQGERFDPKGHYVARYLPELKNLPAKYIHRPWDLGELDLAGMGVVLGKDYPEPIIEHRTGRERALAAFQKLKELKER